MNATTLERPHPSELAPLCTYCDRPMRPVLSDRLHPSDTLTQFVCDGCGWEVVVPYR